MMRECSNKDCKQINPQPLNAFPKDKGKREGHSYRCKTCNNQAAKAWQKTPIGKAKHHAVASAWQKSPANKTKHAASVKAWQTTPIGLAKLRAAWAKYYASKIQRTPLWLTEEQLNEIESYYAESARRTQETGILHHVDHKTPLQGENVSGLHVPWNLQVIPALLNWSKGNSFEPENTSEENQAACA